MYISDTTKKAARIVLWIAFSIYCFVLIRIVFLIRTGHESEPFLTYVQNHMNLIPFKTISSFFKVIIRDKLGVFSSAFINIFGNLLLLFPMGMFLPCLSGKFQKFWKTTLISLGIILYIEVMQILTQLGTFDVDDIILNIIGAMLGYLFIKIPIIKKLLHSINVYP